MRYLALVALTTAAFAAPAKADTATASNLRLKPTVACKGAGRPAPKIKQTVAMSTVGAPARDIDLNGDGWCDWIFTLAAPTNTGMPEESVDQGIVLGTPTGARTFGNIERMRQLRRQKQPVPDDLAIPTAPAGLAPVLVAYAGTSAVPYFMGFSGSYPTFWDTPSDYQIWRWNAEFDTPQQVGSEEYVTVMRFWQKQYCPGRKYTPQDFQHPDQIKPEHPLEVFICAPGTEAEIRKVEQSLGAKKPGARN